MTDKTRQDHHNEGQRDGAAGEYNRPHGFFDEHFNWSAESRAEQRANNKAYDQGYHHGRSQSR